MLTSLLSYPFRVFFLSSGAFAIMAIAVWLLTLLGVIQLPVSVHWHVHEMFIGFFQAAVAGFLLTAVCNWTGTSPLAGIGLLGLWSVWLAGRLGMLVDAGSAVAIVFDLLFLPLVIFVASRPIFAKRQWRQLPILLTLAATWIADVMFHQSLDARWLHFALELGVLLMLIVGSRITPVFSRNWLRAQDTDPEVIQEQAWLAVPLYLCFVLYLVMEFLVIAVDPFFDVFLPWLALAAAGLALIRLWGWSPLSVRSEPMLWVMHIGLLWIPIGLLLRAAAALDWVSQLAWQHAFGVGAIGTMIIGVMARVSLGHTGRPIRASKAMVLAFFLVVLAAIARVLVASAIIDWETGLIVSAAAWCIGFTLFLCRYTLVLLGPRADA